MKAKQIISLLLMITVMIFTFVACDSSDSSSSTTQPSSAPQGTSGILQVDINEKGELIITYTDESEENLGTVVGQDGKDGEDGKDGIDGTDGKDGMDGEDGKDGDPGKDGVDGLNGTLVIENEDKSIAAAAALGLRSAVCIRSDLDDTAAITGAGVIYKLDRAEGNALILTNYHVVFSSTDKKISNNISVYLYGSYMQGKEISATFVGGSLQNDLAILQIKNSDLLRESCALAVTVADSDAVRIGDTAIAIGNPKSSGFSVTSGIVCVDSEPLGMLAADENTPITITVMRMDTPVNGGNSGGGLFNAKGELIGIVTAKTIETGVENVGYAIPSNLAISAAENLIDNCLDQTNKTLQKYTLNIQVITSDSKSVYNSTDGSLRIVETISVHSILEGSHCQGILKENDSLLSFTHNGTTTPITRQYQIPDVLLDVRTGDSLSVTVLREGQQKTFELSTDAAHFVAS